MDVSEVIMVLSFHVLFLNILGRPQEEEVILKGTSKVSAFLLKFSMLYLVQKYKWVNPSARSKTTVGSKRFCPLMASRGASTVPSQQFHMVVVVW